MPGPAPPPRIRRLAGLNNGRNGTIKPISRTSRNDSACGCGNPSFEVIDGAKICLNCGTQVSENNIVAEVTFGETSSGAAAVDGVRVGEDQRHGNSFNRNAQRMGMGGSGRSDSELNGREAMRVFTGKLPISQKTVDEALHLWKLAARDGFTKGRRAEEVGGACLYGACRRDKENTVLLMDLAEVIAVNVFSLGDTYKELAKKLYLDVHAKLHQIEVEPLILKYALKLEFGDKTRQVAEDAVKIIRRMKRDWIVTGRHPAGLCGACIILAARMNNFRRTVREVVFVVKVADLTISKRLEEFKRTRSSFLTIGEFREVGNRIKMQHDPPAIYEAKERARKLLEKKRRRQVREQEKNNPDNPIEIQDDLSRQSSLAPSPAPEQHLSFAQQEALYQQQQQDAAAAAPAAKKQKTNRKKATPIAATPKEPRRDADGFAIPDLPIDPALLAAANAAAEEIAAEDMIAQPDGADGVDGVASAKKVKRKAGRPRKDGKEKEATPIPTPLTQEELLEEDELQDEIENFLSNDECISRSKTDIEREKMEQRSVTLAEQQRAITSAAHAQRAQDEGRRYYTVPDSEIIGEDEFADDPEVQNALLTEAQVKVKEMIWVAHNEDWLRAQQTKQLQRALDEAQGKTKDKIRRRKRSRMGDLTVLEGGEPVDSPAEANRRMLEKRAPKQFSQRINYAALGKIYNRGTPTPSEGGTPAPESEAGSVAPATTDAADATLPSPLMTQQPPADNPVNQHQEDEDEDEDDPNDFWDENEETEKAAEVPEEDEDTTNAYNAALSGNFDGSYGGESEGYESPYAPDHGGDDFGFESD